MGKTRAAVVLFVDIDEDKVADSRDLSYVIRQGLAQLGVFRTNETWKIYGMQHQELEVRIIDVMDAGMAIGNGYLWTNVTHKAWTNQGIYTEKQQAQLDAEAHWEQGEDDDG